jgi:hypothetical protein
MGFGKCSGYGSSNGGQIQKWRRFTHAKISQLVNKMCSQQVCSKMSTSCNNVVILSSCYKVAIHNLSINCWISVWLQVIGTTCNKSVEPNNLVTSCQQAAWEQAVRTHYTSILHDDKLLEQHCYRSLQLFSLPKPTQIIFSLWQLPQPIRLSVIFTAVGCLSSTYCFNFIWR